MQKIIKKINYLTIFYFLFIISVGDILFENISRGYAKESWQITELLINYQGGFVRRGLLGEGLFQLYNYFGFDPYFTILSFCFLVYVFFAIFFIKSFIKKGYPLFALPFVFFLGGPIINDQWVRKDVLVILIFSAVLYFSIKKIKKYLFLTNLFFAIGLLVHEEVGFFCFPILLLIFINKNKVKYATVKSFFISIVQLSPAIATFVLCLYNKGSLVVSSLIWNSWKMISFPIQGENSSQIPAAIMGLSWSTTQGLSYAIDTLKNFNDGIYAPIAWFIIVTIIYYLLTNTEKVKSEIVNSVKNKELNKTNISNILIFQFLSVLPLFILGWDYGRWIFLWVASSFSIIILLPNEKMLTLFPRYIEYIRLKINPTLDSIFGKQQEVIFFLFLTVGVPKYSWSLVGYLNSNPVIIVLRFISKLISYIFKLIHV